MGQLKLITAGGPAEMWGLNIVGSLPETKAKNKYIIVAIHYGTRFCIASKVVKATSRALTEFVNEKIIHQFGTPWHLITDQGSTMMSWEFPRFVKDHKIQHRTTAAYDQQANGLVEGHPN